MLQVTPENCINVLAVADLVQANRLKEAAFRLILRNLAVVCESKQFRELSNQSPHLKHQLLERLQRENNRALLMEWNNKVRQVQQRIEKEKEDQTESLKFPWIQYVALAVIAWAYVAIGQFNEVWLPLSLSLRFFVLT